LAAENRFMLQVITPDRTVLSAPAYSVVLPGTLGEFGVLPGHTAFFSTLRIGSMRVTRDPGGDFSSTEFLAISGGFADVTGNEVTVLTSSAERAEEIDMNRAEAARKRAEERIAERGPELDLTRAQAALARALNRLAVAKQSQP
jgi:F-type H+-transporting ATPase subunit epsilon